IKTIKHGNRRRLAKRFGQCADHWPRRLGNASRLKISTGKLHHLWRQPEQFAIAIDVAKRLQREQKAARRAACQPCCIGHLRQRHAVWPTPESGEHGKSTLNCSDEFGRISVGLACDFDHVAGPIAECCTAYKSNKLECPLNGLTSRAKRRLTRETNPCLLN